MSLQRVLGKQQPRANRRPSGHLTRPSQAARYTTAPSEPTTPSHAGEIATRSRPTSPRAPTRRSTPAGSCKRSQRSLLSGPHQASCGSHHRRMHAWIRRAVDMVSVARAMVLNPRLAEVWLPCVFMKNVMRYVALSGERSFRFYQSRSEDRNKAGASEQPAGNDVTDRRRDEPIAGRRDRR